MNNLHFSQPFCNDGCEVLRVNSANEIVRKTEAQYYLPIELPIEVSIACQRRRRKREGKGRRTRNGFERRLALISPIRLGPLFRTRQFLPKTFSLSKQPSSQYTSLLKVMLQMAICLVKCQPKDFDIRESDAMKKQMSKRQARENKEMVIKTWRTRHNGQYMMGNI